MVAVRLPLLVERPRKRGDCLHGVRPCPWSQCRHHLGRGPESCALDVVDRTDGLTLQEVADIVGITREGTRKAEIRALKKLRQALAQAE
jgi:hypothetical protein